MSERPPASKRPAPRAPLSALGQLNAYIANATGVPEGARVELRSAQAFRETWSRMCAENDVVQAVQRGPENAGPLNSHMLAVRTLELLRGLSPDYLRRFIAHADTLLWLDEASARLKPAPTKARSARRKQ